MNLALPAILKASVLLSTMALGGQPCNAQVFAMAQKNILSRTKTEQHLTSNTQKLRDVLGQLKNHYRVDILFEGGTIEKVTVNQQVVDWNQKIENNLDKLLESTKLKYKSLNQAHI
jgi:diphthamide synthase (EF-2-diphthine--ammonia ligase)